MTAGIMVSASHNPAEDNGLKVLDADGLKLDDTVEDELEQLIWRTDELAGVPPDTSASSSTRGTGSTATSPTATVRPAASMRPRLRIVVDCANGSASSVAGADPRRHGRDRSR